MSSYEKNILEKSYISAEYKFGYTCTYMTFILDFICWYTTLRRKHNYKCNTYDFFYKLLFL